MARELDRLLLRIEADTSRLKRELKVVETRTRQTGSRMSRAFARASRSLGTFTRRVVSARGAMVALAGATALGLAVKRSIQFADEIGKTADRIGISTDALQKYRFAAQLSGLEVSALDGAFEAFAKRLGEARSNTGTLITLLNKMDPALLKNLQSASSTDEAIKLLFEAMAGLSSQADRAALAAAAFGRTAGVKMTILVREGAGAVENMTRRASELGIVLDEKLIRKAEEANDRLTEMGDILKVSGTRLALEFMPALRALAKAFTDPAFLAGIGAVGEKLAGLIAFIANNQRTIESFATGLAAAAVLPLPPQAKLAVGAVVGLGTFVALDTEVLKTQRDIDTLSTKLGDLRRLEARGRKRRFVATGPSGETGPLIADEIKRLQKERALLRTRLTELNIPGRGGSRTTTSSGAASSRKGGGRGSIDPKIAAKAKRVAKAIADLSFQTDLLSGRYAGLAKGTPELARSLGLLKDGFVATGGGITVMTGDLLDLDSAQRKRNETQKEAQALDTARALIASTRTPEEQQADRVARITALKPELIKLLGGEAKANDVLARAIAGVNAAQQDASEAARAFGASVSGALEDAVLQGKALADVLQGLEQDLIRIAFRKAVSDPVSGFVGDLLGGLFRGGGGSAAPPAFAAANLPSPGSAKGNVISAGRILPLTRLPGGALGVRSQGTGAAVHVTVVNNTGAATKTRERRGARGGREIMVVVGESMAADVRTGGPLGRAIRDTFGATVETALR